MPVWVPQGSRQEQPPQALAHTQTLIITEKGSQFHGARVSSQASPSSAVCVQKKHLGSQTPLLAAGKGRTSWLM